MPRTTRTPVIGNAHDCETDDPRDKKRTTNSSKERYDEMNKVCTADSRETCMTCLLRLVEAKELGIECDACRRWSHAKCKKITKEEYKGFEKKDSPFSWMCETCRDQDISTKN